MTTKELTTIFTHVPLQKAAPKQLTDIRQNLLHSSDRRCIALKMTPIEFSYELSPALLRLGILRFRQRSHGGFIMFAGAIAIACGIAFLAGLHEWYVILGFVGEGVCLLLIVGVDLCSALKSAKACRSMPDPTVTVWIMDDSIEFETSEFSSRIKWRAIKKLWRFRDVWLFFHFGATSFFTVPADKLSDDKS